jgi:hypothetical protein
MLKAKNPKIVLDPYEWMPSYGESSVKYHFDGSDLILFLSYDTDDGSETKNIIFEHVAWFSHSGFPSPYPNNIEYMDSGEYRSGKLVEFQSSEAVLPINKHYKHWKFKHYGWVFLSENKRFDIICERFSILEG